jgi:hypothetical protein
MLTRGAAPWPSAAAPLERQFAFELPPYAHLGQPSRQALRSAAGGQAPWAPSEVTWVDRARYPPHTRPSRAQALEVQLIRALRFGRVEEDRREAEDDRRVPAVRRALRPALERVLRPLSPPSTWPLGSSRLPSVGRRGDRGRRHRRRGSHRRRRGCRALSRRELQLPHVVWRALDVLLRRSLGVLRERRLVRLSPFSTACPPAAAAAGIFSSPGSAPCRRASGPSAGSPAAAPAAVARLWRSWTKPPAAAVGRGRSDRFQALGTVFSTFTCPACASHSSVGASASAAGRKVTPSSSVAFRLLMYQ